MSKRLLAPTALALSVLSLPAEAQYVSGFDVGTYTDLGSIPGITGITQFSFNDANDGYTGPIPIGFPFQFFASTFNNVYVSSDGFLSFGSLNDSFYSNEIPGDSSSPNALIAAVWDDLELPSTTAGRYGSFGAAPDRVFVLEVNGFTPSFTSGDNGSWQIWLYEGAGGRFEVRIGNGPFVELYSATMGFEGIGGAGGTKLLTCSPNCRTADLNAAVGRVYYAFKPSGAELSGTFSTVPRVVAPGATDNVTISVRNTGPLAASGVVVDLYLSVDNALDASDIMVGSGVVDVAANAATSTTVPFTVPLGHPVAEYYVLAQIDPDNEIPETAEADNVARSVTKVATGPDLVAALVEAIRDARIGQPIDFRVTINQAAVPYSGPVDFEILASRDGSRDGGDPSIGVFTVDLTGTATTVVVHTTVPLSLATAPYLPILVVDPGSDVEQTIRTNDVLVGSRPFITGNDFTVRAITVPTQIPPAATFQLGVDVAAAGPPYFDTIEIDAYASLDNVLGANDTLLANFVATFNGELNKVVTQDLVLPTMPAGTYSVIAVVDPDGLVDELDENNNRGVSTTRFLNAFEFRVSGVTAPAGVDPGDSITVRATVQSVGVDYAGLVPFRVYFSADNALSAEDVPVYESNVTLAGASTPLEATFAVGGTVQVQSYYVIVQVNPDGTIPESVLTNDWTATTSTLRVRGSDLRPNLVDAADYGFAGHEYPVAVTIVNQGEAAARGFRFSIRISDNDTIRVTDTEIYLSEPLDLLAGREETYEVVTTLPTATATSSQFVGVLVDIFSTVPEVQEGNNIRVIPTPIRVLLPIPNLTGELVATPTAAAAGERLAITRLLQNDGVADATFDYVYYLSTNAVISSDDVVIARRTGTVPEGSFDFGIDVVDVPPSVAAGPYYVGLALDPDGALEEISDDDNAFTTGPIVIYGSTIEIRTDRLPQATLGVAYEAGLYAVGGPIGVTWSVSAGSLPNGLELDPSGIIRGTPTVEGLFNPTIRASSGTIYAEKAYPIRVISPTVPLAVVSAALPTAITGRSYQAELVAIGGVTPYEWSAIAGLPDGVTLSSSGVISGTITARGNFRITARVRDAVGDTAAKDLTLNAINPDQVVTIVQQPLFAATVGHEYCDPDPIMFEARGGAAPYRWAATDGLPEGLEMSSDGRLCGVPTKVGSYAVLVRAQDQNGLFDTALFSLEVEDGSELSISTTGLEGGVVGAAYEQTITAIRGTPPYTWTIAFGALPPGITLDAGRLSGTPTEAGAFAFAAEVVDADGRKDLRPLSIVIAEAPKKTDGGGDDGCGCNTAERSGSPWLGLGLVFGVVALRRRRVAWVLGLLIATASASTSTNAFAQTPVPGTPYVMTRRSATFAPLPNPTVIFSDGVDDEEDDVTLPFQFKFYDSLFSAVTIGVNGGIIMGGGQDVGLSGPTPGSSSTPNGWITSYWEDLEIDPGQPGTIGYQVFGNAPTRSIVFEWRNVDPYSDPGAHMNMQVELFEGPSGKIVVRYGAAPSSSDLTSGTMAMEDPNGARPVYFDVAPACVTNCGASDLGSVANSEIELIIDAGVELAAFAVSVPRYGFLGGQITASVTFANLHSTTLGPFKYALEVIEGATAHRVYVSPDVVLTGYEIRTEAPRATIPAGLPIAAYHMRLVVDSGAAVTEVSESNNSIESQGEIRLVPGRADVAVESVRISSSELPAGGNLSVVTRVSNPGAEDVSGVRVALVLSTNPAISAEDMELGSFTVSLARGEARTTTQSVTLDSRLNSGVYYVGAFADVDDALVEADETNNGLAGSSLRIRGGSVAVATTALPAALRGAAYTAVLSAVGGDGRYTWEIASGTLPAGIGLVPNTGELFGRPSREESATFSVRATSQGQSATRELTLRVVDPEAPLTIVTRKLPSAIIGQEYSQRLEAVGARTASPAWSSTELPEGLVLSEGGMLTGTAVSAGTTTVTFSVTDRQSTAMRSFPFTVRANAGLLMELAPLEPAVLGEPYEARLLASGGMAPYLWVVRGDLPAGLSMSTGGAISGTPEVVGAFRVEIEVRDASPNPSIDTNVFVLTINDTPGFSVSTESLPIAYVNESYEATIETTGGTGPFDWAIEVGRLPKKLSTETLPSSGAFRLVGVPEAVGDTNLLVRVVDAGGRRAFKPFVLRVIEKPAETTTTPPADEGCNCRSTRVPTSPILTLAALALLLWRRRTR
ncbi:MAG: putative Ig domain-containing protein [Deltaproteobacteria bacterium]|nr:putative Ig domain-containing protein [Deltaproteobacteria bacterium]